MKESIKKEQEKQIEYPLPTKDKNEIDDKIASVKPEKEDFWQCR